MDLQLWPWLTGNDSQLSFVPTLGTLDNARRFLAFHFATAMAWDIPRAVVTSLLISMTGSPILHALRRAQRRLALNVRAMEPEEPLQRLL
jgi:energy-coupling factor transport system substrate-specific component